MLPPPSSLIRAPKRSSAGCGEIFPAIKASPWGNKAQRWIRLGGTNENTAATRDCSSRGQRAEVLHDAADAVVGNGADHRARLAARPHRVPVDAQVRQAQSVPHPAAGPSRARGPDPDGE